jgi:hypothetical protein
LHFDWAREALDAADIPYFVREYNVAGLRLALSAFPTGELGLSWVIWVPDNVAEAAKEEIDVLPFDKDPVPGVWDFCGFPRAVRFWRILIWASIAMLLLPSLVGFLLALLRRQVTLCRGRSRWFASGRLRVSR